jgi:hypothetical protein
MKTTAYPLLHVVDGDLNLRLSDANAAIIQDWFEFQMPKFVVFS